MRILGLTDMSINEEKMNKAVKAAFPLAEATYLGWPPAASVVSQQQLYNG